MWNKFKSWLIVKLGAYSGDDGRMLQASAYDNGRCDGYEDGFRHGCATGKAECKVQWRPLPLPFTPEQLGGREYGSFITPIGFGTVFGECNVPAPGPNGYEMHARYLHRIALDNPHDMLCHIAGKFDNPADSEELVPVLIVVLR